MLLPRSPGTFNERQKLAHVNAVAVMEPVDRDQAAGVPLPDRFRLHREVPGGVGNGDVAAVVALEIGEAAPVAARELPVRTAPIRLVVGRRPFSHG